MTLQRIRHLRLGLLFVTFLATAWIARQQGQADGPIRADAALPAVADDEDEFYAHVDRINSPTEFTVTVLDVWRSTNKPNGPGWPEGKAKVKPAERIVTVEDTFVPDNAEDRKAAMAFVTTALKASNYEVLCDGSSVVAKEVSGHKVICIKGCVQTQDGFTLNKELVRLGLASTTSLFFKNREQEAKQKKLGIWRGAK